MAIRINECPNLQIFFNQRSTERIIHKELSYTVTGILFEAHNEVGMYASESEVCDVIERLLIESQLSYKREYVISPLHEGEQLGRHRVDFIIENKIILEVKCKRFLTREDYFQIKRYLTHLNLTLGILINFREERLHPKRILNGSGKD